MPLSLGGGHKAGRRRSRLTTCAERGSTAGTDFVILDAAESPGGSWQHMWEGLRCSPPPDLLLAARLDDAPWDDARYSFPPRTHVVEYLTRYESRYQL